MIYEMLFGHSPFRSADANNRQNELIRNIKAAKFSFPEGIRVSDEAKDLIRKLLTKAPELRLGSKGGAEIMEHPFFRNINWDDLYNKKLTAPIRVKVNNKQRKEVGLAVRV